MALYLDGQKIISGGSGSGGHTIVDNEGVSLEQRTNLQFNGAYSEDNATDDTTEVNVVREMTKAEFDQLTEEEKTGFINITDITGGNDDRFQPVIYSEDEREIGVWTDGKPLYEKTVHITAFPSTAYTRTDYAHNISDIDTICFWKGTARWQNGSTVNIEHIDISSGNISASPSMQAQVDKTYITLWVGTDRSSLSGDFVLQYTKTTDTAGSGQWTPQGVPAVHYSEDEQVVGTWIDGSTLYEKTISTDFGSATTKTINISSIGIANVISVEGFVVATDNRSVLIGYNDAGKVSYSGVKNNEIVVVRQYDSTYGSNPSIFVTIRYTKSV